MLDFMPLPGLSPVAGKSVVAKFDGGLLSSDGGILVLRELEQRLRVADRMAACIEDPRAPDQITHSLAAIIRFRLLMIAAGYEDGNDASSLRGDPMFKMALDLCRPIASCVRSRQSRDWKTCPMLARCCAWAAPWSIFIASPFTRFPGASRSTSTTPSTRCTAASSCGCSMRITMNTAFSRSSYSTARVASSPPCFVPPNGPAARKYAAFCAACCAPSAPTGQRPRFCCALTVIIAVPRFSIDWCRANGLDYILGVAPTSTLQRHIEGLEASTKARFEAAPKDGKARRFKEFYDGAASWSRVERVIARVEVGAEGPDTRFVVTNLKKRNARVLYEDIYCRRGQAENHIKSWKTHLAADRTSCTKGTANQLRLFLHAGAYWLMWGLRVSMPKRSMWRVAQFDTLRLRLIKIAARVVEMKTMLRVHLPTSCPGQDILRFALGRIPRLVT